MTTSMLMVIHRMVHYIIRSSERRARSVMRLLFGVIIFAVLLDCLGIAANIAVSAYNVQVARAFTRAADALGESTAQSGTAPGCPVIRLEHLLLFNHPDADVVSTDLHAAEAFKLFGTASFALKFQNWAELLTLLIIIATFLIVTPLSAVFLRRAHSQLRSKASAIASRVTVAAECDQNAESVAPKSLLALQIVERAADDTLDQKFRILATCVWVTLGLMPRAVFDVIQAIANIDTRRNPDCGQCEPCQSVNW